MHLNTNNRNVHRETQKAGYLHVEGFTSGSLRQHRRGSTEKEQWSTWHFGLVRKSHTLTVLVLAGKGCVAVCLTAFGCWQQH